MTRSDFWTDAKGAGQVARQARSLKETISSWEALSRQLSELSELWQLATEEGDVVVVRMGEKFEVLATNTLEGQVFLATPSIMDGRIYLRGQNTLFCVR